MIMSNKICKNCVMDNTDPSIKFDSDGICSHCNNYFSKTLPKWQKLLSNKKGLTKLRIILNLDLQRKVNTIALLV